MVRDGYLVAVFAIENRGGPTEGEINVEVVFVLLDVIGGGSIVLSVVEELGHHVTVKDKIGFDRVEVVAVTFLFLNHEDSVPAA